MPIAPASLILVVVMNNPRDLEIARVLGWYRIPLRSAPRVIGVDYLAFYQTGSFIDQRWQVRFVAPVRGYELTTRLELLRDEPEHPHAQHEYYKVQLGPLEQLAQPLPAGRWRRITFFYTTGEYFSSARCVDDLIVQAEQRQSLWAALHERASQSQQYRAEPLPDVELEPALVSLLLGLDAASLPEKK